METDGISVCALCPSYTNTPFLNHAGMEPGSAPATVRDMLQKVLNCKMADRNVMVTLPFIVLPAVTVSTMYTVSLIAFHVVDPIREL